ncbi:DUF6152 family protein [Candidatus Rariloculus sp.]|uniref:DUF6152 family protein n=1 Tax=Candidatus Rariloculus sp. TaxID=3101265 RepID=UPI003D14A516
MTARLTGFAVAVAALVHMPDIVAHHSFAAVFDADDPVELSGTVSKVEWFNPHVWFNIDVENDDGTIEDWALEMGSPNRLMRSGWNAESMTMGDMVIVTASRARDGSRKAAVVSVKLSTGEELFGAQDSSQ